jgi:nucleoside-diphosphate-sugar epimerase
VKDTCAGFIAIAESELTIGREINISSNQEISILNLLNSIKEIMKSDVEFIDDEARHRPEKSEVFRLWGDNTLLRELTGFKLKHTIQTGLKITCDWFVDPENLKKFKPNIYNI